MPTCDDVSSLALFTARQQASQLAYTEARLRLSLAMAPISTPPPPPPPMSVNLLQLLLTNVTGMPMATLAGHSTLRNKVPASFRREREQQQDSSLADFLRRA